MKTISILIAGLLLFLVQIKGQDTNKVSVEKNNVISVNVEIDVDEIIKTIEENKLKMEEIIYEKQAEIDKLIDEIYELTSKPDGENVYENQIDSLDSLIDVNEMIIEDINEAMEELSEEMEDLAEEIEELNIEMSNIEVDDNYYFDDDDDDKKSKKEKKFKGHYSGLQLGLNSYVDGNKSLNLPVESEFMTVHTNKSWQFDFNPLQFSIPFFNRYVGAVTGLGFSFNNYELLQNVLLGVDAYRNLTYSLGTFTYTKNRFKTASLNIPLIIEFQIPVSKSDKRIFLGAGVIGSLNLAGRMKTTYFDGQTEIIYKDKISNWPISTFSYQATARFGYDQWYLFANYSLVPLFENNKGPELYPVSAGIGLRF